MKKETGLLFSTESLAKLNSLARMFSTSLFVILQATFKIFLFKKTDQNDILIGTHVFGRDYKGWEDQIGCYARTALIRTIFKENDSFQECISKVVKSNRDMYEHRAFSLKDMLDNMLPPDYDLDIPYWNINIQYYENRTSFLSERNLSNLEAQTYINTTPMPLPSTVISSVIPIDMQLQFYSLNNELNLEVQYDGSRFDKLTIENFTSDYLSYAEDIGEHFAKTDG